MKILWMLLLPLVLPATHAEDTIIKLDPIKKYPRDYGPQLIEKFGKLLKSDAKLRQAFEQYEKTHKESFGEKYGGANAQSFVLRRSEHHLFDDRGGWEIYAQTEVVYYSFSGGMSKGQESEAGVFAIFEISGKHVFKNKEEGGLDLFDGQVTAKFEGFRTTITAEQAAASNGDKRP